MNPSAAFVCLCVVAVYSTGEKTSKAKRDVSGLYPFPRVGRGEVPWNPRDFGPREMKRQGLIPFPRVGRNRDDGSQGKKRDMTENGGGMWFGPRLGRLQKRKSLDQEDWALLIPIKDLQVTEERKDNGPRFRSESSEEVDQSKDYLL